MKSAAVLTLVCLAVGTSLAVTWSITKEKIEEAEQAEINSALAAIFPSAEFVEENGYYRAFKNENLVGYAAITEGMGYGGKIKLVFGVSLDGTIEGIRVISHSETPGLGSMVAEDDFLEQFEGKSLAEVKLSEEGGEIDAVTGATISSKAVVTIVHDELQELVEMLSGG